MNKRYDIDYFIKTAKELFGGECLSKTYTSTAKKLRFRCKFGHIFMLRAVCLTLQRDKTSGRFFYSSWCPDCLRVSSSETVDRESYYKQRYLKIKKMAESKGGKLLTTKMTKFEQNFNFECKEGHKFTKKGYAKIFGCSKTGKTGGWCPTCVKPKYSIRYLIDYAQKNDGTLLSPDYKNKKEQSLFKCKKNHIIHKSLRSTRLKTFCSFCEIGFGRWKLPNLNHEKRIVDIAKKQGVDLKIYRWNRLIN